MELFSTIIDLRSSNECSSSKTFFHQRIPVTFSLRQRDQWKLLSARDVIQQNNYSVTNCFNIFDQINQSQEIALKRFQWWFCCQRQLTRGPSFETIYLILSVAINPALKRSVKKSRTRIAVLKWYFQLRMKMIGRSKRSGGVKPIKQPVEIKCSKSPICSLSSR